MLAQASGSLSLSLECPHPDSFLGQLPLQAWMAAFLQSHGAGLPLQERALCDSLLAAWSAKDQQLRGQAAAAASAGCDASAPRLLLAACPGGGLRK